MEPGKPPILHLCQHVLSSDMGADHNLGKERTYIDLVRVELEAAAVFGMTEIVSGKHIWGIVGISSNSRVYLSHGLSA